MTTGGDSCSHLLECLSSGSLQERASEGSSDCSFSENPLQEVAAPFLQAAAQAATLPCLLPQPKRALPAVRLQDARVLFQPLLSEGARSLSRATW